MYPLSYDNQRNQGRMLTSPYFQEHIVIPSVK